MEKLKNNEKIKSFITKIKSIKNIEIIIAVIIIAILILIYSYAFSGTKKNTNNSNNESEISSNQDMTAQLEINLENILCEIENAGKVEVMITYYGSIENVIANTTSTHSNSSNSGGNNITTTSTITETPIIVTNNGQSELYVTKKIMPEIKGVIVVAEGADDARVRLELMRALQTILDINANNIEIFAMK